MPSNILRITLILFVSLFLAACGGGSSSSEPDVTPPPAADTTAPVITLNGEATIYHEQGTSFTDPGASATDDTDGSVAVTTTGSVGDGAGTYTLTYTATDAAGNSASINRTVIVEDTTAPVVSLEGESVIEITVGDSFTDPGATASDSVDGSLDVVVSGEVNSSLAGTYTITYTATDAAGNESSVTRTVVVVSQQTNTLLVLDGGQAGSRWELGINAFDAAINYSECNNDGGAACPSIAWRVVEDQTQGTVLEVEHAANGDLAGLFVKTAQAVDLSSYQNGALLFELRTVSGDDQFTMKLDCGYPCSSGDQTLSVSVGVEWQTITIPLATLASAGLDLTQVDTGIVIWASSHQNTIFQLDDVRFSQSYSGESSLGGSGTTPEVNYQLTTYGAATVSDTINPASYRCVFDYGNWIYNAGVVAPGIAGCDTNTGTPSGDPTPLSPQLAGPALTKPVATHRWWGSIPFLGEMTIGDANDAAYITPDPIISRISNTGFRLMGIPAGAFVSGDNFGISLPDPFAEVFDGMAIANSVHSSLEAYAYNYSDASIQVEWQSSGTPVMHATFVHGSPFVYVDVLEGDLVLKTLRADSGEKGIYYEGSDSLGVWTSVAGNTNHFLITGDGATTFTNVNDAVIGVANATKSYTITLIPTTGSDPSAQMISDFEQVARNVVQDVVIGYQVDMATQAVTVTHEYHDAQGAPVETIIGMMPLHWKKLTAAANLTGYQIRSARGVTKFAQQSSFSYQMPYVGVLPTLPTFAQDLDLPKLQQLVQDFIDLGASSWNPYTDTYWSGKSYGKVAEIIAIADAIDMISQRDQLLGWLKSELEDWFNAERDGTLDTEKYFVYDSTWTTLLGMEESFAAHQQLNDHHFHYGYFVRAAAEVCRQDIDWCSSTNYGPMVKLLIRDYAGGRDDQQFPYLRHFDPANGFSWASGNVNFVRGNNNESTSEAANAYGAMVLFGLLTGDQEITERGIYLHASTANTYWEYWNNIDGYSSSGTDVDNFPSGYNRITTSILWGDGAVFSTWFSAAYAHILGIQGLPSNTLTLHIGQYANYLQDYVGLGLFESSNGMPSGLLADQWRDIWWNIWALTDPQSSIADYLTVTDYDPEEGESKAHTYHWIYTFNRLGQLATGTGSLTADYPAAMAFDNNGVTYYVIYNFGSQNLTVNYSDGTQVSAGPNAFGIVSQ